MNSVLYREPSRPIQTSILSRHFKSFKSFLFRQGKVWFWVHLSKPINQQKSIYFYEIRKNKLRKTWFIFKKIWNIYYKDNNLFFQSSTFDKFQQDFRNKQIHWKFDKSSSATPTTTTKVIKIVESYWIVFGRQFQPLL